MRNIWSIARRELYAYFSSPIAYVTTAAFLAVEGFLFYLLLLYSQQARMYVLGNGFTIIVLVLYAAVVTMRLLAEEQQSGTIELVLTAPVRDWEVIVGKYLASLILFLGMLVISLYQPIILSILGSPDWGVILSGYLGFFLLGAAMLSVGTLASTFTRNQVIAAILTIAFGIGMWLLQFLSTQIAGAAGGDVLMRLAILNHFYDFEEGLIRAHHVIYYLSLVAASLFLATQALQARRWR